MHIPGRGPPFWRVLLGFVVAPAVAAAVFVGLAALWGRLRPTPLAGPLDLDLLLASLGLAVTFGIIQGILLGLPLHLLLARQRRPTALRYGLIGAALAAGLYALPELAALVRGGSAHPECSWTAYARNYAPLVVLAFSGAVAGIVFWMFTRVRLPA